MSDVLRGERWRIASYHVKPVRPRKDDGEQQASLFGSDTEPGRTNA